MKKSLLLLLLAGFGANAQFRERNNFEIIPEVGYSQLAYSYATTNASTPSSSSTLSSVNFGVAADYYFANRWSLRSGLLFQTMGATNLGYATGQPFNGEEKLNYLNVPVNANWHFGSTRNWNLNFGLTPGFLLSATAKYPGVGENNMDIKSMANTFQMGLSYGLGYKIEIANNFGILMDYQGFTGLTKVNKQGQDIRNNGFNINLGGVFTL